MSQEPPLYTLLEAGCRINQGRPADAIALLRALEPRVPVAHRAVLLRYEGIALAAAGDPQAALACLERAQRAARACDDREEEIRTRAASASAQAASGALKRAIALLAECVEASEERVVVDDTFHFDCVAQLGGALADAGEASAALTALDRAIELSERVSKRPALAELYTRMAADRLERGDVAGALLYKQRSAQVFEELRRRKTIASVFERAAGLRASGDGEAASARDPGAGVTGRSSPGHAAPVVAHPVSRAVDWEAATREAVDLLSAYLRIDTAQPAGRTREAATFLATALAAERVETRLYETDEPDKVNLLGRLRSAHPRGKALLLGSHMDVVPAVEADWTVDPFGGLVADGYVHGRGALDMKGMGIMELMAMLLVARAGVELERDVILLCTCDEEVPSELGTKWMVDRHLDALDPAYVLNEGGSGLRGVLAPGDVFEVAVAEKRGLPVRVVAHGASGHGSQPWDGAATHRLVRAAHAILADVPQVRECAPMAELVRRLGGAPARRRLALTGRLARCSPTRSPSPGWRRATRRTSSRSGRR